MAIKNQYVGINAHLQSALQQGDWDQFHALHMGDLMKTMNIFLRPMGYIAAMEQSLQVRQLTEVLGQPRSDITIYDRDSEQAKLPTLEWSSTASLVMSVPEALMISEEEMEYRAVAIYSSANYGTPVAWLELLSPSNKPLGQKVDQYVRKRRNLIDSGIVFIEIDYLHESPPSIGGVGDYRREKLAHPYRIAVIHPRVDQVAVHEFDVETPIPTVQIPLSGGHVFSFDFGLPYHKTFEEAFYGDQVDYTQLPLRFERYQEGDQLRIVRRMLTVKQAVDHGQDLEQGPFPLAFDEISLDEGVRKLQETS